MGDISKVGNFSSVSKPEYCSATLPCKRKTVMKKDCHSVENFTKMPLQYRKSIDDTHMNQIGGGLGESLKSRDASMVELACSGNKDTEKACDSKELEIVEIIVHQDVKNTENQKESYNSQEKTVTIDVSIKVAQNSDVHKEKKKERSKRRSEKRTLVGLPMPKQQPSLLPTEVKNNALNNITANVYHTKLKQTSPMVEASDSQESFVEQNSSMQALPDTQVKARPSQSSKNLLQMQDSAQVTSENVITSDSNDSQSIIPLSADTGSSPVPDICTSKDFNEEDFKTYTNTLKDECLVNNENTVRVVAEQILKWEPLGRVLGLSEPKIIVIQINNQHDYEEQKYQCIMKWISERGQATTLITLLRKIYFELEDKSLVMKITQKLQQKPPTMQPSPTKAQKIYISYCEEDTTIDFIKRLKSDLMKFRYEVFWDERNINNGNSATEKLAEAISSCDVIIVVMTKKYFESEWCGKGFTFPDAQKKKLIFIKWEEFDDSEIAGSTLKNQLWLNFIKDEEYDDSFEILAKELAQCKKAESAEAISAKRKSCMVM